MAKVAIDCDGVLANFGQAFIEFGRKTYPDVVVPRDYVQRHWDVNDVYTPEQQDHIWRRIKATENFWLGMHAYAENVGGLAIWLIKEMHHEVYVVTSRLQTAGLPAVMQTDWWLRSCGIRPIHNYFGIIVVPDSSKKAGLYRAAEFGYSIDDKLETVQQCDAMKGDHKAYLLDQPWNQDGEVKRRVKSMDSFLREIK